VIVSQPSFSGRIGFAQVDITPPVGIYARNWGAAKHDIAEGIHRPLHARALVLQSNDSDNFLVLASLDLGWWKTREDEWYVRGALLEKFGLDEANLLVSLTHTHAGPVFCREDADKPGGHLIAGYLEQVRDALITATRNALSTAQNATLEWATGTCTLAQNRDLPDPHSERIVCGYRPNTPADDTLLVGRVSDATGKTLCVLANYACHPTTLAHENRLISPDWLGAFYETIATHTGAPSLFLQGASGELQPREAFIADTTIADSQGRQFAYSVLSTLESMLPPQTQLEYQGVTESGAPLAIWQRTPAEVSTHLHARRTAVELPLKDWPTALEMEAERQACLDRALQERLTRKIRVRKTVGNGTTSSLPVWIWELGDALLIAQREECYSCFQQELRRRFPDKAIIVINLTNGSCGYLPPAPLYELDIYQVWQTPYAQGGAEKLLEAVAEELGREKTVDRKVTGL